MSRIHDALRKAEEERASQPLDSRDTRPVDLPLNGPSTQEDVLSPVLEDADPLVTLEAEKGGDQLTVEILKSKVRKSKWNPNPKTMLFFGEESYALGTEEFRTLRSKLYGLRDMQPLKSILITSASPGDGKSFIAANLAQIFVQQPGRRVLLIDGDLRWSRLHLSLGTPTIPGLTEYLEGEVDELAAMQRGPLGNLFFIAGGRHAENPSELIANGRMNHLLRVASPLFDWIILDSPPAMAVSDPRVMSDMCDGVLLVVAADKGPYEIIQKTTQQFKGKRMLGVVLNRAEARNSYSYKYYGYYQGGDQKGRKKKRKD
ncbi:MAG TPA: CpsD/CapB family tyrosine-protein kinase [Terriglobia bacterium]|nr:CpsD/CapB family tyrosine-protein kinase [Terriglobia bacterium]